MQKCYLLTVAVILFHCCLNSQSDNLLSTADYPRILAPSPEAAALGKYGETPVSLFSGTPQIGVPIYNFKYGDISISVSLSYNAGGIRLDEIATNVGLGWSLNAGGVITRSVLGIPDFVNDGFPDNPNDFDPGAGQFQEVSLQPTDYFVARDALTYNRDTERDIYYYNFSGYSGKFIFDSLETPCLIPANPSLKILPYNGSSYLSGFIVIDDKGFKYFFTQTEGIGNVTTPCNIGEEATREYTSYYPSAWYLTKIESPGQRTVTFEYQPYEYTVKRSYKEVKYIRDVAIGGCYELTTNNRQCTRIETIDGLRIKKIILSELDGEIIFGYSSSNRLDLTYDEQDAGNSLDSIYILRNGKKEQPWFLSYDYFGTGSAKRLKLLSVQENNNPPYEFLYNETHTMPERLSFPQDHWGFYNGKSSNSGMIPVIPEIGVPLGANREPDFDYMQSASLIKIEYPTGGYTEFEYEPHTDMVNEDSAYFVFQLSSLNVPASTGTTYMEQNFSLPSTAHEVHVSWELEPQDPEDLIFGYITDPDNTAIIYKTVSGSGTERFYGLTPGETYKLRIFRANTVDDGILTVSWYNLNDTNVTHQKIITGGLRIQSIRNYTEEDALTNKKHYFYNELWDSTKSTAIIPGYNANVYWDNYEIANENAYNNPFTSACPYYVLSSSTRPEIGSGLDVSIGYRQIVETDSSSAINGRTIYTFSRPIDFIDDTTTFQTAGANLEWCKGLLLEKRVQAFDQLSSTFKNVSVSKSHYKTLSNDLCRNHEDSCRPNQKVIPNFRISYLRQESPAPNDFIWAAVFSVEKYYVISNWVFLSQSTEVVYDTKSGDSIVQVNRSFYGDPGHGFVTQSEKEDSKGLVIKTQLKYPTDYSGAGVYDTMIARNIISPIIEVKNFRDDVLLSTNKVNYALWQSNQVVAPDSLQFSKYAETLGTELDYAAYDDKSNPLEFVYKDGVSKSYIWDYNKLFPIAECAGAGHSSIAYTSFEADGKGGWSYSGPVSTDASSPTGRKCYNLSGGDITKTGLASATYVVSYWSKSGSVTVNSSGPGLSGKILGDWRYYEHKITSTSFTVSGNKFIDELRLYPEGSQMSTVTYTPLLGVTSQCDINNRISRYEYDKSGRLFLVRDDDKRILKKICYNYSGQSDSCVIYYNVQKSDNFTRNNCGSGYDGSSVPYIVPAGTYISYVSQNDADSLAEADVDANGQAYANANGNCTSTCNSGNCSGLNKKCINGTCETGVRVCIDSYFDSGMGMFLNTYHYEFSDSSWSSSYQEYDYCDCTGFNCV